MRRSLKEFLKRQLHTVFLISQRFGLSVLPLHFYSSIPNSRELLKTRDWKLPRSMYGVATADIAEQLAMLAAMMNAAPQAQGGSLRDAAIALNGEDGGYGEVEAEILSAFVRTHRPAKIVQVGCGVSTALILGAGKAAGYIPEVVCIDPYPTPYLKELAARGDIVLVANAAQAVDLELMTDLKSGDFLFIDSTHAVKPGSEVNRIILEVLPRLSPGVWVHFHDICFPYEYSRDFMAGDLYFSNETTLLYAFLLNNPRFRIMLCASLLHYRAPAEMQRMIALYRPQGNDEGLRTGEQGIHFPSSLYLRVVD